MNSNDIYESIAEKVMELSGNIKIMGIPITVVFLSKIEYAEIYKRALYDYSIEKLFETDENKVIVEDLSFIFERFENQFTSKEEKDNFYNNYICSILSTFNELTGKSCTWRRVDDDTSGDCPMIDDDFVTNVDMDNKDAAIWLFKRYEQEIAELKREKDKKQKTHKKTRFGKNPFFL